MAHKNPESEDDFIRMQQEAIRRVRDMQDRARSTLESAGVPLNSGAQTPASGAGHTPLTASGSGTPRPNNPSPSPGPGPAREARPSRPYTQSVWNAPMQVPRDMITPPAFESRNAVTGAGPSLQPEAPFEPPFEPPSPGPRSHTPPPRGHPLIPSFIQNLLPSVNINLDSEQVLLLILIFVLYQDRADNFLVMALVYILLL